MDDFEPTYEMLVVYLCNLIFEQDLPIPGPTGWSQDRCIRAINRYCRRHAKEMV